MEQFSWTIEPTFYNDTTKTHIYNCCNIRLETIISTLLQTSLVEVAPGRRRWMAAWSTM